MKTTKKIDMPLRKKIKINGMPNAKKNGKNICNFFTVAQNDEYKEVSNEV